MEGTMNLPALYQVAEIELVYKTNVKATDRPKITCSKNSYDLLLLTWDKNKIELLEQFKVILLNRAHRVIGIIEISSGGITETVVDARLIFAAALKANAVNLILAHNHPSENAKPSTADEILTDKIKKAGELLRIQVLDHIIVCKENYFSFADEGLL